jgi:hypothetical protein
MAAPVEPVALAPARVPEEEFQDVNEISDQTEGLTPTMVFQLMQTGALYGRGFTLNHIDVTDLEVTHLKLGIIDLSAYDRRHYGARPDLMIKLTIQYRIGDEPEFIRVEWGINSPTANPEIERERHKQILRDFGFEEEQSERIIDGRGMSFYEIKWDTRTPRLLTWFAFLGGEIETTKRQGPELFEVRDPFAPFELVGDMGVSERNWTLRVNAEGRRTKAARAMLAKMNLGISEGRRMRALRELME